jgi:N-acetylmuramoyl-L-alanine amidase
MPGKIIVLDPGHGLDETGFYQRPLIDCTSGKAIIIPDSMGPHPKDNTSGFYREDFGTLALSKAVELELENMGHTVFLTRGDNRSVALFMGEHSDSEWKKKYWQSWKWTYEFTKEKKADIFVSIHTNAGRGTGCSAFWANPPHGVTLCQDICNEIKKQLGLKIRKIDQHRYLILRDICNGRAVLVECLFHDNYEDLKLILDQQGINTMAKAIAAGISNHANKF